MTLKFQIENVISRNGIDYVVVSPNLHDKGEGPLKKG